MTDTRLSVALDDLCDTTRRLADVAGHLAQATHRVDGLTAADAGDVRPGLHHFADHWSLGMGRLRHHVQELHDALAAAHQTYQTNENELSHVLEGRS